MPKKELDQTEPMSGSAHPDIIRQQPEPFYPALFRVELDSIDITVMDGRGKTADIFRCRQGIFREGVRVVGVDEIHVFLR